LSLILNRLHRPAPGPGSGPSPGITQAALLTIAVVAVLAGTAARLKGLGTWSLAWDEYYLAQSIQYVLHTGLPEYPCGGLYSRGVLIQYGAALLQLAGMSAELAPRLIAALSSLLALAAAFRLARRCGGKDVALLVITLLALSVWEVEIARFGRMYAPFQAIFLWYMVFFLDYTVDRKARALTGMLVLSVVGALVWEGAALLALANFLPPFLSGTGRLTRQDVKYLAGVAVLFVPIYWFTTADLRVMGTGATLPADYQSPPDTPLSVLDAAMPPWRFLLHHPGWMAAALVPLAVLCRALQWLLSFRDRPVALLGLAVALGAASFGQFLLCAAVILLLLLMRLVEPRELAARAVPFHAGIASSLVFWTAYGLSTQDWHGPTDTISRSLVLLFYEFAGFPDFIRQVAIPWAHALPSLGAALSLLLAVAVIRAIARNPDSRADTRILLVVLVALLVAASAASTPRHETRYVFFLYPAALIIALTTVKETLTLLIPNWASAATAVICLGGFALTEDFRPSHLLHVDSAEVSFRQGIPSAEASQYPARADIRGAARWLDGHVTRGSDLVVNGFPGVDFYYPGADYFFMESSDSRFEGWSCRGGAVDRWSNRPLLYSIAMLDSAAKSHPKVWLVIESPRRADVLARLASADPAIRFHVEWVGRNPGISIVSLEHSKGPA
jgi:Dolichyl-phosphate-mannose-protein mannosyltransferase